MSILKDWLLGLFKLGLGGHLENGGTGSDLCGRKNKKMVAPSLWAAS